MKDLVTGNTIVVKPSSVTPINCHIFAEIIDAVGLPAGVFNVVDGPGAEIGNALSAHPQVDMVSLTGSVEAGRQVMEAASANITKVSLELGGKAPAIVLKDADLDLARIHLGFARRQHRSNLQLRRARLCPQQPERRVH